MKLSIKAVPGIINQNPIQVTSEKGLWGNVSAYCAGGLPQEVPKKIKVKKADKTLSTAP